MKFYLYDKVVTNKTFKYEMLITITMQLYIDHFKRLRAGYYGDLVFYLQEKVGLKGWGYELGLLVPNTYSRSLHTKIKTEENKLVDEIKLKLTEIVLRAYNHAFDGGFKSELDSFELNYNYCRLVSSIMQNHRDLPYHIKLITTEMPKLFDFRRALDFTCTANKLSRQTVKPLVLKMPSCHQP